MPDKVGTATAQLLAHLQDTPDGGTIRIPRGTHVFPVGVTIGGQRHRFEGEAGNVSFLQLDASGPLLDFDSGGGGGQYQSGVRNVGFYSANTLDKTAIRARNVANLVLEDLAIAGGHWPGANSCGVEAAGRELVVLRDCVINTARPVVFNANPDHPTLCTDHFRVEGGILQGASATHECLEFGSGCVISNTTIEGVAFVNGRDGIRWLDYAPSVGFGASFHLKIADCRFEQGLDPSAWCINLQSTNNGLQELIVENCRIDSARNGILLRNVLRAKFDTVTFDSVGRTALDVVMVPGSRLEFLNCTLSGGAFTIVNGRCIRRLNNARAQGFSETWVYDSGTLAERTIYSDAAHCAGTVQLAAGARTVIADARFSGKVEAGIRNGFYADFQAIGTNQLAFIVPSSNIGAVWSDTLGTGGKSNLQHAAGSGYVIENGTAGPVEYWYELTGRGW